MGRGGGTKPCPTCRDRTIPRNVEKCGVCESKVKHATKTGHGATTHACKDGKTRTMRGGVCPGPYC